MRGGDEHTDTYNSLPTTYENLNSFYELLKALYSGELTDNEITEIERRSSQFYKQFENSLNIMQQSTLFKVFLKFKQGIYNKYMSLLPNITNNNVNREYQNFETHIKKLSDSLKSLKEKKERNSKTLKNRFLKFLGRTKSKNNNSNNILEKERQIMFHNIIKNCAIVLKRIFDILDNYITTNNTTNNNTTNNNTTIQNHYSFNGLLEELRKIFKTEKNKLFDNHNIYKLLIIFFKLRILDLKILKPEENNQGSILNNNTNRFKKEYTNLSRNCTSNQDLQTIQNFIDTYQSKLNEDQKLGLEALKTVCESMLRSAPPIVNRTSKPRSNQPPYLPEIKRIRTEGQLQALSELPTKYSSNNNIERVKNYIHEYLTFKNNENKMPYYRHLKEIKKLLHELEREKKTQTSKKKSVKPIEPESLGETQYLEIGSVQFPFQAAP